MGPFKSVYKPMRIKWVDKSKARKHSNGWRAESKSSLSMKTLRAPRTFYQCGTVGLPLKLCTLSARINDEWFMRGERGNKKNQPEQ